MPCEVCGFAAAVCSACADRGVREERAAIVEWLRGEAERWGDPGYHMTSRSFAHMAAAIERGVHVKAIEKGGG